MGSLLVLASCSSSAPTSSPETTATTAASGSVSSDAAAPPEATVSSEPTISSEAELTAPTEAAQVRTGAQILIDDGLPALEGQRIGLIVNHTATTDEGHLVDLLAADPRYDLVAIFGPEHGFRGSADAGEATADATDPATGLPIFSLYGATKKPTPEMLAGIDVLVYDIADVGTRFYTFISTMGLAMQAAAEVGIGFVVLDRPNPNPGPVSGFVRTPDQESFISQYPIPSLYGLTAGELATAIVGEGWMAGLEDLDLTVIQMDGWTRSTNWPDGVWTAPSPGLPSLETARAYPGTVLFEATIMSLGRGTDSPFAQIGAPWFNPDEAAENLANYQDHPILAGMTATPTTFTPIRFDYMVTDPLFVGENLPAVRIGPGWDSVAAGVALLVEANRQATAAGLTLIDRPAMFDLLAGTTQLRTMLDNGASAGEIIAAWQDEEAAFDAQVAPYRLYPD